MTQPSGPLADDPAVLKELLAGKDALIGRLIEEITRLRRWRFGRSAERLDEAINPQLPLDNISHIPELPPDAPSPMPTAKQIELVRAHPEELARLRAPRALPPELPRQTVMHRPASCQCPECGARMRRLGEDISEMLDYVPGHFQVIRHVRPKLSVCNAPR
jgi:transposase